jgi:putative hydrolase of the HAD superfamily
MQHALDVLERIELSNFFDEIYDIKMANYIPKPEIAPYQQLIEQFTIEAESAAMFDDIAKNLVPAKKVGFTSVWIDAGYENFSDDIQASKKYLDHETTNITEFLENVNKGNI